ncbi:Crp/Fnr family transcriptional regulator [Salinithrix halophila]|uniref:Crp/Fnr family transcriptional regulator n=1 Tax=Salinithrix halophila TaxID=1485204 RepID=A0ABV8JBC3_9BACL
MILHRGEILFRQGEEGYLFHLKSGLFKVSRLQPDGTSFLFNLLVPGETFPHHSLLTPQPYYATAVALTTSEVERIPAEDWYRKLEACPEKYREVALSLQYTLRTVQQRIGFLTAPSSNRLRLLREWLHHHFSSKPVEDLLTQEELGQLLGLTRETVNRLVREERRASSS